MANKSFSAVSKNLSIQLIELRRKLGLSQEQLAKKCSLPRSTISNLESGSSNPALDTLVKLRDALGVKLEELIVRPAIPFTVTRAINVPQQSRGAEKILIKKFLPPSQSNLELDEVHIERGGTLKGLPHAHGTFELTLCLEGSLRITLSNQTSADLEAGDFIHFPGRTPHSYINLGRSKVRFLSLIALSPLQDS